MCALQSSIGVINDFLILQYYTIFIQACGLGQSSD